MTSGPRNVPVAPNTAPGAPTTDGGFAPGVAPIGEGFEGSLVMETPDDGKPSSVTPQEPLPENATETEKELVENKEDSEEDKKK